MSISFPGAGATTNATAGATPAVGRSGPRVRSLVEPPFGGQGEDELHARNLVVAEGTPSSPVRLVRHHEAPVRLREGEPDVPVARIVGVALLTDLGVHDGTEVPELRPARRPQGE